MMTETLDELERAVNVLVEHYASLTEMLEAAEQRNQKLNELVKQHVGSDAEPDSFVRRYRKLERENTDLKARIEEGKAGIDRALARIRFIEDL